MMVLLCVYKVNSFRKRQDGWNFANIFQCIFLAENCMLIWILQECISNDPIINLSLLIQVMAWHNIGNNRLITPTKRDQDLSLLYGITMRWLNTFYRPQSAESQWLLTHELWPTSSQWRGWQSLLAQCWAGFHAANFQIFRLHKPAKGTSEIWVWNLRTFLCSEICIQRPLSQDSLSWPRE